MARIAFIGMGEAGSALITGWGVGAHEVSAYDIKTDAPDTRDAMRARYDALGLRGGDSPAEALAGADLVLSVVTADQAMEAAEAAAPYLAPGALYCDLNSCAPSSKRHSARVIEAAGGAYVDVAVMAPVHPALNDAPLLVSGPHAERAAARLAALPMRPRVVPGAVGRASTIKMVRSVLIKGLEALTAEFFLAVEAAGVADEVLPTLKKSYPGFDWPAQGAYNFERAMVHGGRRAAEMTEVARTLADLGLPPDMVQATVKWEARLAKVPVAPPEAPRETDVLEIAAALLPHLRA